MIYRSISGQDSSLRCVWRCCLTEVYWSLLKVIPNEKTKTVIYEYLFMEVWLLRHVTMVNAEVWSGLNVTIMCFGLLSVVVKLIRFRGEFQISNFVKRYTTWSGSLFFIPNFMCRFFIISRKKSSFKHFKLTKKCNGFDAIVKTFL